MSMQIIIPSSVLLLRQGPLSVFVHCFALDVYNYLRRFFYEILCKNANDIYYSNSECNCVPKIILQLPNRVTIKMTEGLVKCSK